MASRRATGAPRRSSGETLTFMQALWGLNHGLAVSSKRMLRELGVTGPQRLVIRVIGQSPGISPRDIAATLDLHPSTLTGVLHRLQMQGFIERRADPDDRRRARCFLKGAGRIVNSTRRGTVEAAVRRALARASKTMIDHTAAMMRMIVSELDRDERADTRALRA